MDETERQKRRADLWAQTFVAMANNTLGTSDDAVRWADKALATFDERFPKQEAAPRAE